VPDTEHCAPVAAVADTWTALEDELLTLINEQRALGGSCGGTAMAPTSPLASDPALRCAARLHSADMAARDYFSHGTWDEAAATCTTSDECSTLDARNRCYSQNTGALPMRCLRHPGSRMVDAGASLTLWGENLYPGSLSPADVLAGWLASSSHCQNLLSPSFSHAGLGYSPGGSFDHLWTLNLAD